MNLFLSSHRSLLSVALSASLLAGLTSCQDEDFGYAKDEIAYETNFKKAFGNIPADQSWDLSSAAKWVDPLSADGAMSETRATRAGGLPFTKMAEFWEVPNGIFSWMQSRLIEGNDNRYLGSSFILQVPNSDFAIIPIFQGNSAITSELEVKVNGFDLTKVWTKSEGMKATDTDKDSDAKPLGYYEGWSGYNKYYDTTPNHPASTIKAKKVWTKPIVFKSSDLGAGKFMYLSLHNIAKLYNSDGSVWDSGNTWTTVGDRLTSINPDGQMLALDVDWTVKNSLKSSLPQIVEGKEPSEMMIIGCEDANGSSSDHDNNDIVFLIVGYPSVPTVIPLTETIEKRYMCEDLGGTHDFDFNDIVVDVKQVSTYTLTTTPTDFDWNFNGGTNNSVEISGVDKNNYTRKQTAKIAHVCGTLPIQAQVGNYLFPWITDPVDQSQTRTQLLAGGWNWNGTSWVADETSNKKTRGGTQPEDGWNPNEEKVIADNSWNPAENNVTIYVQWPKGWKADPGHTVNINGTDANQSHSYLDQSQLAAALGETGWDGVDYKDFTERLKSVAFPKNGTVPYIIAVDPSVKWMKEDQPIDMAWLRQADHTTKDHTNESGVGSGGYYENPNSAAPEVVVWQGSFTGEKWNHGKDFPVGSAEYNGIIDAFDGYAQCNTLNIYFDKVYTDRGNTDKTISLATHDPGWVRLTDTEADNYVAPRGVTPVTIDGKQCYRLQIKLTSEQIAAIRTGGLVVQLSSDNVMLHKISFTKESGFEINLTMPEHGKIETASRKRERYDDAANTGRVPFTHAAYVAGSSVELVAVPDEGYMFDGWVNNSSNTVVSTSVRYTVSGDANLSARFVEAQYIPVGLILQSRPYDSENYSDDYKIGNPIITVNDGKFYKLENDAYVPMSETTFTVTDASSRVYVVRGTSVTFSIQKNSDYIFEPGTSFEAKETAYERTSDVVLSNGNTQYTPYVKFKEKKDPGFSLLNAEQQTIVLDYNTPSVNIGFTKDTPAPIQKSGYEYSTEVNIWNNNDTELHMRAQEKNFSHKKITIYVDATDEYKSAEIELDVTVQDYRSDVYSNGYRVPITNNAVLANQIKDALHWDDKNKKNIKVQVKRGDGIAANASVYSSTSTDQWTKTIRNNGSWTSFARGNDDYGQTSYGMPPRSICLIISAEDFANYFKEWNSSLVFDAKSAANDGTDYTGWEEVYVSYTDDSPFQ